MARFRHETVYLGLGERIREGRERCGLTQAELASSVGLTRTSISNIEKGRQKMLVHTLYDVAAALGVEAKALLPERPSGTILPDLSPQFSPGARNFVRAVIGDLELRDPGDED